MNLRISDGELRFRISEDERVKLAAGEELSLNMGLPGEGRLEIRLGGHSEVRKELRVESGDRGLELHWPIREEAKVEMHMPDGRLLKLILEVDLFSKKKKVSR